MWESIRFCDTLFVMKIEILSSIMSEIRTN